MVLNISPFNMVFSNKLKINQNVAKQKCGKWFKWFTTF